MAVDRGTADPCCSADVGDRNRIVAALENQCAGLVEQPLAARLRLILARRLDGPFRLASRSLIPKANTWYTGTNIAGKPRTFPIYVAGLGKYTDLCNDVAARGYEGLVFA
jgi:hypothetical protein